MNACHEVSTRTLAAAQDASAKAYSSAARLHHLTIMTASCRPQ
jgi:hypothetical protein